MMSEKKEIRTYISENLKKGYTKEQVKATLINRYPEKTVLKQLIEYPDPLLFEKYKSANYILIGFLVVITILKLFYAFSATGLVGIVTIFLNVFFIIALFRGRGWVYPVIFLFSLLGTLTSLQGFFTSLFGEFPPEYAAEGVRAFAIILSSLTLASVLGMLFLSIILWRKIHPEYKWKNLFTV